MFTAPQNEKILRQISSDRTSAGKANIQFEHAFIVATSNGHLAYCDMLVFHIISQGIYKILSDLSLTRTIRSSDYSPAALL